MSAKRYNNGDFFVYLSLLFVQHKTIIIMSNPLFNIQYGLFVVTACDNGHDRSAEAPAVSPVSFHPQSYFEINTENY